MTNKQINELAAYLKKQLDAQEVGFHFYDIDTGCKTYDLNTRIACIAISNFVAAFMKEEKKNEE